MDRSASRLSRRKMVTEFRQLRKTLMTHNLTMQIVDMVARGLELVGVAVIAVAFVYAALRAVRHYRMGRPDVYDQLKIFIGRGLQLGLEFLVAADIISTVTVEPTREQIVSLGILIVIRTVSKLVNHGRN